MIGLFGVSDSGGYSSNYFSRNSVHEASARTQVPVVNIKNSDTANDRAAQYRDKLRQDRQAKSKLLLPNGCEDKLGLMKTAKDYSILDLFDTDSTNTNSSETKTTKQLDYNYKEVATKIQTAKTSISASRAVLSASRKVLEVKRKLANGDGDPEELQLALTHAKRMEIVAKRKRNHLEQEELVANTRRSDEKTDALEKAQDAAKQTVVDTTELEIDEAEDDIFEGRQEQISELASLSEESESMTDDMLAQMNQVISELGDDLIDELEDTLEQLEELETVDPHMSEEDFEKLKRKHRDSEDKQMVKANMDYIKGMVKHLQEKDPAAGISLSSGSAQAMTSAMNTSAALASNLNMTHSLESLTSIDLAV